MGRLHARPGWCDAANAPLTALQPPHAVWPGLRPNATPSRPLFSTPAAPGVQGSDSEGEGADWDSGWEEQRERCYLVGVQLKQQRSRHGYSVHESLEELGRLAGGCCGSTHTRISRSCWTHPKVVCMLAACTSSWWNVAGWQAHACVVVRMLCVWAAVPHAPPLHLLGPFYASAGQECRAEHFGLTVWFSSVSGEEALPVRPWRHPRPLEPVPTPPPRPARPPADTAGLEVVGHTYQLLDEVGGLRAAQLYRGLQKCVCVCRVCDELTIRVFFGGGGGLAPWRTQ